MNYNFTEKDTKQYLLKKFRSNLYSELNERLCALEKKAKGDLLPFTNLPDFTDHGVKHALSVQQNLSELIPEKMPEPLSAFEVFCLLSSAQLHDIGMLVKKSSDEPGWQTRVDHYSRSKEFVISNHEALGLSEHEAKIIGEICRAHGMPNLDYLDGTLFAINEYGVVRVRLLSALLRLADALDITSNRAPLTVSDNRKMSSKSRKHWDIHQCISAVQILTHPSWDIRIVVIPDERLDEQPFYQLRNEIQKELDTIYPVLRACGIFFKKIELILNRFSYIKKMRTIKNPFVLLRPFSSWNAGLFAGRDKEIQQMIERIFGRRLVVLIGESGVGKTSLVDAGVIPKLKTYEYKVVRFLFQHDPIADLKSELTDSTGYGQNGEPLVNIVHKYLDQKKKDTRLLIIGDHLEQMFTVQKDEQVRRDFIEQVSRVLGSSLPVTFLFCIREDYLPDLYNLSLDMPDLYDRDNTFRLHRLSRVNGIEVLRRASQYGSVKLSEQLIKKVSDDLFNEGDGMIYPPFLQIVGYRLYAAFNKHRRGADGTETISEHLYTKLGGVEKIVNRYLDSLLDLYKHKDKPIVGEILNAMVTEYYTKKRVKKEELQRALPACHNLDKLLKSLVDHRIVRRSLGEYELIHDFLARRVIEFIEKKRYLSAPVRRALEVIEKNYSNKGLTSGEIAKGTKVSQMHLASLFRTEMESTINKQLNEIRVAKAKEMLRERIRLSEIATKTGFSCLSAFSRKFSQIEGVSPLEFRKIFLTKPRGVDYRTPYISRET